MSTRVITLFSTKGGKQKVETDAKTWGELKPLVKKHYDLKNLQPTENINKTTLLHKDAILPEGEFVLFLRPIKTKSGSEYQELRAKLTDADKERAKKKFGKNWTQLKTTELREIVGSSSKSTSKKKTTSKKKSAPKKKAPAKSKASVRETSSTDNVSESSGDSGLAAQVIDLLKQIQSNSDIDGVSDKVDEILPEVEELLEILNDPDYVSDEKETEELGDDFKDMMKGF